MRTSGQMKHYVLIALSGMFLGAELVASHVTQSLVLLTDAYHMLYNVLSLVLLIISYKMSKERTLHNTFGWVRIEVLGILINILFLCALYFAVSVQALQTMFHSSHEITKPLYPLLVLTFGLLGIALNLISFLLIGGYTHYQDGYLSIQGNEVHVSYVVSSQQNMESRQLICATKDPPQTRSDENKKNEVRRFRLVDLAREAAGCLLVTICGCIIYFANGGVADFADPVLTLLAVILLVATMYPYLKETGLILLQNVPHHIDIQKLKTRILNEFPAILNVHDLHIWRLTNEQIIATTHIILTSPSIYCQISPKVEHFFKKQGITLATIQPEFCQSQDDLDRNGNQCILMCKKNCRSLTCCDLMMSQGELHHRHGKSINSCPHSHLLSIDQQQVTAEEIELVNESDFSRIPYCKESDV